MFYNWYPRRETVTEKKAKAAVALAKLKKKDPSIAPVIIQGRKLARTWWGEAWISNLERYADYVNRIDRGRSYVRNGMVLDLKVAPGQVDALVQGSSSKPYSVKIQIKPLSSNNWKSITSACEGRIESLQELMEGKFPKTMGELFTALGTGLFPAPKEITFECSCPDWASMCKHVAAALYGVGARLDDDPTLFFVLRNIKVEELISHAIGQKTETWLGKSDKKSRRSLKEEDLSGLFGIDVDTGPDERGKGLPEAGRKAMPAPAAAAATPVPATPAAARRRGRPPKKIVIEPVVPAPAAVAATPVPVAPAAARRRGRPPKKILD
ncbi:MAG TPA: hypothetical protein DD727_03345 [Clostridiales bacterium]|nr:hypothetical protein [Clostridiales bacterium]